MKTAILFFRKNNQSFEGEYYQKLVNIFVHGGISVDEIAILSPCDLPGFILKFEEFKNTYDNLVIFDGEDCEFDLKKVIAEKNETVLVENENAKSFIKSVCGSFTEADLAYAMLPAEGTIIPNVNGIYQGFILDAEEFTLALLPGKQNQCVTMCEQQFIPYLNKKHKLKGNQLIFKYFGNVERCEEVLKSAKGDNGGISYQILSKYGDGKIIVSFNAEVDSAVKSEFTRKVISELKEDIYAEFDTTLGERLFDILKIKKLKLATAESFTGGGVANAVVKNSGVSEFFTEGLITYSNQSKVDRLGVTAGTIGLKGAVSSEVAYQMVVGLLRKGNCDIALATTGIAGPNSDGTSKPVGLAYIAVGMKDGVHTYRYQFSGTREEIMETAKNTALFLIIKKLKNV